MQTQTTNRAPPPRIPRGQWASHPRFPQQALLLGSHEGFRRFNRHLAELAARSAEPGRLESRYRSWISAMRSHEAYEEHKLYPYLARRFGVDFAEAEAGHHALHERHAEVLSAFAGLRGADVDSGARAALVRALDAHEATLSAHLGLEEDLVIPALLAMSPAEFERYYYGSIHQLLADLGEAEAG